MTTIPSRWKATLLRRSALTVFMVIVAARYYVGLTNDVWALEKIGIAITGIGFFLMLSKILDNNALAFDNNARSFARIAAADEERLQRLSMLRMATESLAKTLELIRDDLASNTQFTRQTAEASIAVAEVAAEAINQHKAATETLKIDLEQAAIARKELKDVVDTVHHDVTEKLGHLEQQLNLTPDVIIEKVAEVLPESKSKRKDKA